MLNCPSPDSRNRSPLPARPRERHSAPYRRAIADCQVSRRAHLSRQNAAVSHFGCSGETHLAAEQGIFSHFACVAHLHQIVDLCAAPDSGFAHRRAIDCAFSLDFHVVSDDRDSRLPDLVPAAIGAPRKTETIAANDGAVLQQHAVSDLAILRARRHAHVRRSRHRSCARDKWRRSYEARISPDLDASST